jgi:hypothetical protein
VGFAYFVGKAKIINSFKKYLCTYTGKPKGKRKRRAAYIKGGLANKISPWLGLYPF